MMDPFSLKKLNKIHPIRLIYTLWYRLNELYSRLFFKWYELPYKLPILENKLNIYNTTNWPFQDTAVTSTQAKLLGFCATFVKNNFDPLVSVVEIGAYRGVTTSWLSKNVKQTVYAIDPYIGYGGCKTDLAIFNSRTANDGKIKHICSTSGTARMQLADIRIGFIFIDAVHDFANTMFDVKTWEDLVIENGFIAFHDVDDNRFSGTRRVAFKMRKKYTLYAHIDGLAIFQKTERCG